MLHTLLNLQCRWVHTLLNSTADRDIFLKYNCTNCESYVLPSANKRNSHNHCPFYVTITVILFQHVVITTTFLLYFYCCFKCSKRYCHSTLVNFFRTKYVILRSECCVLLISVYQRVCFREWSIHMENLQTHCAHHTLKVVRMP